MYNCFNEETAEYSPEDVAEIRIYADTEPGHRLLKRWEIELHISMKDGENFYFSHGDFATREEGFRGSITGMTRIKSCFDPRMITIEGEAYLPSVVEDMHLNRQETELLYLLFDIEQPER